MTRELEKKMPANPLREYWGPVQQIGATKSVASASSIEFSTKSKGATRGGRYCGAGAVITAIHAVVVTVFGAMVMSIHH
jgi:hypothetical protein